MYKFEETPNIPAVLHSRMEEYLRSCMRKVDNICRGRHISKAAADAMATDMAAIMHARYQPLAATQEHITEIVEKTQPATWDKTENPLLCIVYAKYRYIYEFAHKIEHDTQTWIHVYEWCEIYRLQGKEVPQGLLYRAQIHAYMYCVLCTGEMANATQEELEQIKPYDSKLEVPIKIHNRLIEHALQFGKVHRRIAEEDARQREQKAQRKAAKITSAAPQQQVERKGTGETIRIFQNMAYIMGKDLQTAEITNNGQPEVMRPLWQAIEEKKQWAEQLINDKTLHATPEQIQQAQNLIATVPAIYTTLKGIQVLPQLLLPDSGNTTTETYTTTPHQFTCIATGVENPNPQQVTNCMRALDFLSRQRMEVAETVIKKVPLYEEGKPQRDANGRIIYQKKPVQAFTRFNPCTTIFYGEYEEAAQATTAKRIVLQINNIITQGRSAAQKQIEEANGKKMYPIALPQVQRIPIWQIYDFAADEEQRFMYALLSKPHCKEADLLEAIFMYKAKQAAADKKENEAYMQLRNILAQEHTEEEEQNARIAYKKAKEAATDCTTKHAGRDKEKLQAMFCKAQDMQMIKYWCKKPTAGSTGKRITYIYEWGRYTEEEIKKYKLRKI